MKRLFLSGASGFLGRNCTDALAVGEWEIHAVDRQFPGEVPADITAHQIDLLDRQAVAGLMREIRPTHLLHLAWTGARPVYNSLENFRWVRGSLRLVEEFAAAGGRRAVSLGSCAEYRWGEEDCSEERTPLATDSVYGVCKGSLSRMFGALCRATGVSGAWPRAFFLYGPYEHPQRFVASVITALLKGEPARCTHGGQIRDFMYSRDLAAALVHLLETEFEGELNVATGRGVTLAEIAGFIATELDREDLLQLGALAAPEHEAPRVVADVSRLDSLVGWRAQHELEEGLRRTIDWWRDETSRRATGAEKER